MQTGASGAREHSSDMEEGRSSLTIVIPEPADNSQDTVRPDQLSYSQALAARALLGLRLPASSPSPPTTSSPSPSPSSPSPASPSLATPVTNNTLLTLALAKALPRRPRGEKKPIPEELKDNKYFERRKRNNLAAKKSRDQRKVRESQVCQRATLLEKENAVLRAQVGLEPGPGFVLIDQLRYSYLPGGDSQGRGWVATCTSHSTKNFKKKIGTSFIKTVLFCFRRK